MLRAALILLFRAAFSCLAGDALFTPRVMVVTTFEVGADTGDTPGEFQFWVEREKLDQSISVPGMDRPIRYREDGLFACVSGTTVRCAEQILLMGVDTRFDFSHTYWLVNGIAGVNPERASVGCAAWARWMVDGDLAYEIDGREIPSDWSSGLIPLGGKRPGDSNAAPAWVPKPMAWELNALFVQWAYEKSRLVHIPDSTEAMAHRQRFKAWPAAQLPPHVLLGDSLGSCRYWHGVLQNQWANEWVRLHTHGNGDFVMTDMEDHGLMSALSRLSRVGKADFQRVLVLRTGSNYSVPRPGQSVSESLHEEYQGIRPALEAAYLAGSAVVHALLDNWPLYKEKLPSPAQ